MSTRVRLIGILADGALHSGPSLAEALGVSRSAIWKQMHRLGELGLTLTVVPGRGYRLQQPLELLDRERILACLGSSLVQSCDGLQTVGITESTSAALLGQPAPLPGRWVCMTAEYQSAGRGRRGRRWLSPYAGGLCLSLSWSFDALPPGLPALSLAMGLAVRRVLAGLGLRGVQLKWPNDVLLDGAKLAGILVDVDGDARGPLRAVIGLGLNIMPSASVAREVVAAGGFAPAALGDHALLAGGGRNALAARLIAAIREMLVFFAVHGFAPLAAEWQRHDHLLARPVVVTGAGRQVTGISRGVAADGALMVEEAGGLRQIHAGEVSLRSDA